MRRAGRGLRAGHVVGVLDHFPPFSVRRHEHGELDQGYASVPSSWRCGVSSGRAPDRIFVRNCSSEGFRGSTWMETQRVGPAGPIRLLFVSFRDGCHVGGYPLGYPSRQVHSRTFVRGCLSEGFRRPWVV